MKTCTTPNRKIKAAIAVKPPSPYMVKKYGDKKVWEISIRKAFPSPEDKWEAMFDKHNMKQAERILNGELS